VHFGRGYSRLLDRDALIGVKDLTAVPHDARDRGREFEGTTGVTL